MKRFLLKLFLFILAIITIVVGVAFLNGKKYYDKVLEKQSLSSKVQEIRDSENFVRINDVPEYYINAVIAVEDHRFRYHGTIDIISLARAIISNFKQKDFVEGGSTITQQTAKNLFLIEEDDVINRKIAEFLIGVDLEKKYSKDEILEFYINTIYFGDGYYGIKEACNGYLKKDPKDITISEATMLAGVPNAPSIYAPTKNLNLTQSRQRKVIRDMVEYKYLTQEEANKIKIYGQD